MEVVRFILRESRRTVALAASCSVIAGLGTVGLVAAINLLAKDAADPRIGIVFAVVCVLSLSTTLAAQVLVRRLASSALLELRANLCRRILDTPLRRVEAIGPARLLATLTGDVDDIALATGALPLMVANLSMILGCLLYLGWLSAKLLGLYVLMAGIGVVCVQRILRHALSMIATARSEKATLYRHFTALTGGLKELILHRPRRQDFEGDLRQTAERVRSLFVRGETMQVAAYSVGQMMLLTAIAGVLIGGREMGIAGQDLRSYAIAIIYMMGPLGALISSLPAMTKANVALRSIRQLALADAQPGDSPVASAPPAWQHLRLTNVSYKYGTDTQHGFEIGPVDLTLVPGRVLFIVGGNGSGKSTLAKVLVGLYPPSGGSIEVDGSVVTHANLEWYKTYFSAVFADTYVFDRLYGVRGAATAERAAEMLAQLRLAEKVSLEGDKYSTTDLSQGERKRLALLTAYLEDRAVYVFDEWAADQDPEFRSLFYTRLVPALKARGKGVVVISHDDRYFSSADQIVKMEEGRPVAPAAQVEAPAGGALPLENWRTLGGSAS